MHVICIHVRIFFNGIQWQSDICVRGLFPSFQNKIITAIIYGQFSFSVRLCSILCVLYFYFFFALPNKKIVWSWMSSHAIWSMSLFKWPQYTFTCVCVRCVCYYTQTTTGGTWLFRLLSSLSLSLIVVYAPNKLAAFLRHYNSDNTICSCARVFVFITLIKIKVFSCDKTWADLGVTLRIFILICRIFSPPIRNRSSNDRFENTMQLFY